MENVKAKTWTSYAEKQALTSTRSNKLNAHADRDIVGRKFTDYGTSDVEAKAKQRYDELANASTAKLFLDEMRRFLPAKRVAEMDGTGLHDTILAASGELIKRAVLPIPA